MSAAAFLDTNVIIYAFTDDPRRETAEILLATGGVISVQVLNEFANAARRKLGMDWAEVRDALSAIRTLCPSVIGLDVDVHEKGMALGERYGLSVYDSLIVAAALQGGCKTLLTEDLQDGLVVERRLTVHNPFRQP
ncbi:MAG: PIN domain-containing protein [Rhizobiaceae bacterium]